MFNKLKGTFDRSVAAVSVKSETLVESSRTKTAITSAQNQITALTNALGQKVYQSWKAGNTDVSVFAEDLEHIVQLEQEIAALKQHLEEIKEEENRILGNTTQAAASFCTNCGKQVAAGSKFCDGCGTPIG